MSAKTPGKKGNESKSIFALKMKKDNSSYDTLQFSL